MKQKCGARKYKERDGRRRISCVIFGKQMKNGIIFFIEGRCQRKEKERRVRRRNMGEGERKRGKEKDRGGR